MMDESNPYQSPKANTTPDAGTRISRRGRLLISAARPSLAGALVLVAVDAILSWTFLLSILVCPVSFLMSLMKNVLQLPGWRIALLRIAVPALTLGIILTSDFVQCQIAHAIAASRAALPFAVAIWIGCVECRSDIGPDGLRPAPFPARPLTKVWEGWGRGGGCLSGVRYRMKMLLETQERPVAQPTVA